MPLTLEKLFSKTVESILPWDGEVVHMVWAPARYTGEMDDLVVTLSDEEAATTAEVAELVEAGDTEGASRVEQAQRRRSMALVRTSLSKLLVSWDLMDGKRPYGTDLAAITRLPDIFVTAAFLSLGEENQPDPQSAPSSDDGSGTPSSAPSQPGIRSSKARTTSGSRRGTSNSARTPSATTRSGGRGR